MRRLMAVAGLVALLAGTGLLAGQAAATARGALARWLVERALEAHLRDGRPHRPWSWADTSPLAELSVPRLGLRRVVLSGASGASLAHGVGHVEGTAAPNAAGGCLLAGHRDGDFAFLRQLVHGDQLVLHTAGRVAHYEVTATAVVHESDPAVLELLRSAGAAPRLVLVTCYPFDGLVGGPLRYVVVADHLPLSLPAAA
jgi:sortase A